MTKNDIRRKLAADGADNTDQAIADLFDISYQAVQKWPDDEAIPRLREYELRETRPAWFRRRVRA